MNIKFKAQKEQRKKNDRNPDKTYVGTAPGHFKKRHNNHTKSFRHKR